MSTLIDSHIHLCLLHKHHPDRIGWLTANGCAVISWAFGGRIESLSDLKSYLAGHRSLVRELRGEGLDCFYLCGVHPRKIPPDLTPEDIADLLVPYVDDRGCLGIGEIGLETGSTREKEVLIAQLEFGLSLKRPGLRFGIHTPRREKEAVTRELLSLLSNYASLPLQTVIDHCTVGILGEVLSRGYHAGISLSPEKTSETELSAILARFGADAGRLMCNTDSSTEYYEDLVQTFHEKKIEKTVAQKIFHDTAEEFFGIASNHGFL